MRDAFEIAPATPDRWADVERLFGERGACAGCWCMFFKLPKAEYDAQRGAGNKRALRKIMASGQVPGLIALANGEPVGWCAVEPREAYSRITRSRSLKPFDERPAWAITCFFVAKPWRRKGVSVALLRAAAEHARERGARERGARVIEGYPVEPKAEKMPDTFAYHGLATAFRKAGFREVRQPSATRRVMQLELQGGGR